MRISERLRPVLRAKIFLIAALSPLAACVELTPEGASVRITTNPDVVRGCEFRGNVQGNSTTWGLVGNPYAQPNGGDQQNAQNELLNRAASMGANVIYLNSQNAYSVIGEAYLCSTNPQRTLAARVKYAAAWNSLCASRGLGFRISAEGSLAQILVVRIGSTATAAYAKDLGSHIDAAALGARGFEAVVLIDRVGARFPVLP